VIPLVTCGLRLTRTARSDPLTFRPIIGWITVMSRQPPFRDENLPKNNFCPVVLSDLMFPVVGPNVPNYCGVFLKDMTEAEAKVRALEWMKKPGGPELQPTTLGIIGQA